MHRHPLIGYLATGGTISSTSAGTGTGVVPSLTAAQLIDSAGFDDNRFDVIAEQAAQLPSASFTFDTLRTLDRRARAMVDRGVDAVVVTQGTDSLEETAFFFDLTWDSPVPVVFTGAMRNPDETGADGARNLRSAILVGGDPSSAGRGPLVVVNDRIHAAGLVRKAHTSAVDAFVSDGAGPVGEVVEDRPSYYSVPARRPALPIGGQDARIAVYRSTLGDSDDILRHIADGPYDGLVVEGFGGGHVAEWQVPAITGICSRMPVILTSRTGGGRVLESTYGFSGSEIDLTARGVIPAGHLNGLQARMLLWVLLSRGAGPDDICGAFSTR